MLSGESNDPFLVIPAKAGIQKIRRLARIWMPACAGMTDVGPWLETSIKLQELK